MFSKPTLIIIRGIPGSGKSTLARMTGFLNIEADMFRYLPDGTYFYSGDLNSKVHKICESTCEHVLSSGRSLVVSNTFILNKYIYPYVSLGKRAGASIKIVEASGDYKSVHGVPEEQMDKCRATWEPLSVEYADYVLSVDKFVDIFGKFKRN